MLRSLFYAIPADLRHTARRLFYLPKDLLSPLPGLSPPRGLIYTGGNGDKFVEEGRALRDFLLSAGVLNSTSRVLDIGSGIGRLAIPLTDIVRGGEYEGFDVVKFGVRWCQKNISPKYPHFKFSYFDLNNDLYKSSGASATQFTFPYERDRFSLAVATSVFTHMVPEEVVRYLHETARVLGAGGRFVFTAFVLDERSRASMRTHRGLNFAYDYGTHALLNARVKSANVAYDREWLASEISDAGFIIRDQLRGRWSGLSGDHPIAFQDVYVLEKPGPSA